MANKLNPNRTNVPGSGVGVGFTVNSALPDIGSLLWRLPTVSVAVPVIVESSAVE